MAIMWMVTGIEVRVAEVAEVKEVRVVEDKVAEAVEVAVEVEVVEAAEVKEAEVVKADVDLVVEAQAAKVPKDAVRVYVINHRANMDPLILAYGLLRHVPMSYAVGEWALVWPLDRLFRAFGSYFVRRGEKGGSKGTWGGWRWKGE